MRTTQPLFDESIWKPHLAAFAPLPEPFVRHIFNHVYDLKPSPIVSIDVLPFFDQVWLHVQHARQIVSRLMVPVVAAQTKTAEDRIIRRWFREHFKVYAGRETVTPATTVQGWVDRHLLRTDGYRLEPNSVSSIYMMRYLFQNAQKFWVPRRLKTKDAWFYVYGLRPSENIPQMYPYPLPPGVNSNMLFWTQWIGASWLPGWIDVPGIGALAWGKTIEFAGGWYWDLTEDQLAEWDRSLVRDTSVNTRLNLLAPIIREQGQGLPDAERRYMLTRRHDQAQMILQHIGEPILAGHMLHYGGERYPDKPYVPF